MKIVTTKKSSLVISALLVIFFTVFGCARNRWSASSTKTRAPVAVVKSNDGWETVEPGKESLDARLLTQMFAHIADNSYKNIHSVLIVKNGKLVAEKYFSGQDSQGHFRVFGRDSLNELHSATKSIDSILIGIAVDQHLISGVDEKISTFFPEYADIFADRAKGALRLRDFLSMTSGLSWDEAKYPYSDSRNDQVGMNKSADPVRYTLGKPVVAPPGTKFNYNSGISIVLGEIIHKVSGLQADKFAERYLFNPLGITDYFWQKYSNGTLQTGGGLYLRSRDMAKIGQLLLNGGRWQGKEIVSENWIQQSIAQNAPDRTYGYQWWLGHLEAGDRSIFAYGAQGRGGQFIIIMPEVQMVAVFTGWNEENGLGEQPYDMLQRYILPAAMGQKTNSTNL